MVFVLIGSLQPLLSGCSGSEGSGSAGGNGQTVPAVEAVQAKYGSLPLTERLSGLVKGKNQIELYPQISAQIIKVFVQNGDAVESGESLVNLRDNEFRERLKQAEADYQISLAQARQAEAEAKRLNGEYQRSISLSEKSLISPTELETAETRSIAADANAQLARARVEQTQALVDQRKEELSRTVIRAPVDGTVGNRNAEVGMLVTPSTRIFTLGQLDSVRVEVVLTDHMLAYIKKGQRSEILSSILPSGVAEAPVARISPFLHPVTHSTRAEIDLGNPDGSLKPGMFVTVDIFYGESDQATLVPLSALWENPATATVGVFVYPDSLPGELVGSPDGRQSESLTEPVSFKFIPVDVVAKGRLVAGVRGIDPGNWVVTIGQELFDAENGSARVRPIKWERIEELQQLQREDLLEEIMRRQQKQAGAADSALIGFEFSAFGAGA